MQSTTRTRVGGPSTFLTLAIAVVAAACSSSQPQPAPAAGPAAAPAPLSPAERAAWYQACWGQFNAKAWDQFKACYADGIESDQVDSGRPAVKGIDAVLANTKELTTALPDIKGSGQLILINGDTLVSVYLLNGTHSGPLAGPDGKSLPPTGKPIGYLQAHWVQTDATGNKAVKEAFYSDSGTMMAQLGVNPAPARPVMTSATASPTVVIAGGSPAEQRNVDAFKAQIGAFNSHDAKGSTGDTAPDAIFRDITAPKDMTAKENVAGTVEMFKAFPDAKLAPSSIWGAGDYVVVVGRFEGTNTGPFPMMGIKKATGKPVGVGYLEVVRFENGKVKEDWLFYNGMAFASQLGLMEK
jgi:predicted ester cyclase